MESKTPNSKAAFRRLHVDVEQRPTRTHATRKTSPISNDDEKKPIVGTGSKTVGVRVLVSRIRGIVRTHFQLLQKRVPIIKRAFDRFERAPPRVKLCTYVLMVLWKIFMPILMWKLTMSARGRYAIRGQNRRGALVTNTTMTASDYGLSETSSPLRVLYVVTALSEYNTGDRQTEKGQDRLKDVMMPAIVEGVETMVSSPFQYHVDVYLVLAYPLLPERRQMIVDMLPNGVGLEVFDNAAPLSYARDRGKEDSKLSENTRALSRQHRYVIKDKLYQYNMFLAFEDDMLIKGEHIDHFLTMSRELKRLEKEAPTTVEGIPENKDPKEMKFAGSMTKDQMSRLIPGFIRVEVLQNEAENGPQTELDPIAVDLDFNIDGKPDEHHVDPATCCHLSKKDMFPHQMSVATPNVDLVVIWETAIKALSLRKVPSPSKMLDWLVLEPGPGKRMDEKLFIGGYWSGRDGAFGDEPKPTPGMPNLIAQQGGWMATRDQIIQINENHCMGSLLPPFDKTFRQDGQESNNVEFWSGGYQMYTGVLGGCNMQRVLSFHPDHFSKHLIYHTANNKQRQLNRERLVKVDTLFGQLNSVRKAAERALQAQTTAIQ